MTQFKYPRSIIIVIDVSLLIMFDLLVTSLGSTNQNQSIYVLGSSFQVLVLNTQAFQKKIDVSKGPLIFFFYYYQDKF